MNGATSQKPGVAPALLCCGLLVFALPGLGQTNRPAGPLAKPAASDRILLIVETTAAMQKRADNVERLIGNLFSSGLDGQLKNGDTIGVWTYNETLQTGEFPLKRWTSQASRQIAGGIVQFVEQQKYAKQPRLTAVMPQLTKVVADSDRITVILISDGSEPLVGTPFDEQIAAAFKLNAAEQRRQAMPFVTILRAVKGKYVGVRVNIPPWPLEMPPFPREPAATPTPTNPPPPKAEAQLPPPLPITPVVPEPLPKPVETNLVTAPATNPPVVETKPTPAPVPESTAPPPAAVQKPAEVKSNRPPTQLAQTHPAPVAPTPAPTAATPVANAKNQVPLIPIVTGGVVVLLGATVACFALLKRTREPRVSLITRSMNKDRK
jgi:hypothetical protein